MLTALTLIVLISASQGPQELALHDAVRTSLGENVSVSVRVAMPLPDAPAALELLQASGADAIAIVEWSDAHQLGATVQVYRPGTRGWLRRTIMFDAEDSSVEKGRALGFAIAAMLPDPALVEPEQPHASQPPEPSRPAEPPSSTPPTLSVTSAPNDLRPPQNMRELSSQQPSAAARGAPVDSRSSAASIDAALLGALAFGRSGSGRGGALGGQWNLSADLGARLDVAARAGAVSALDASSFVLDVALGAAFTITQSAGSAPLAFDLRLAALARYLSLSRDGGETHARWLPGARVSVSGVWRFTPKWGLIANIGLDSLFGSTAIVEKGKQVSNIGAFDLTGQVGFRIQL